MALKMAEVQAKPVNFNRHKPNTETASAVMAARNTCWFVKVPAKSCFTCPAGVAKTCNSANRARVQGAMAKAVPARKVAAASGWRARRAAWPATSNIPVK